MVDADVAEAAGALAASFETASRGVVYEHPAASPTAESLRRELKAFLAADRPRRRVRGSSGGGRSAARHRARRHARAAGVGAGAVDYLSLVARILQERPPESQPSSLIIP